MTYTWEESDIQMGRKADHDEDHKFMLCIGFCSVTEKKYGVTYIDSDGMFLPLGSKADVAAFLNKQGYKPCDIIAAVAEP
jgi:hypothetical protein